MKNLNPRVNPVTTILGTGLVVAAVCMFAAPLLLETPREGLPYWIPKSIGITGLCMLFIPDDLKGFLRNVLSDIRGLVKAILSRYSDKQ